MAFVTVTPNSGVLQQDIDGSLTTGLLLGFLDAASATLFNYLDAANNIFIEVVGQGIAYNQAGTEVTGGTVTAINIKRDFGGGTVVAATLTGFNMSAAALDDAVRAYQLSEDPAQWQALFGANNFSVTAAGGNLNFRGFAGNDKVLGGDGNDTFSDFDGGDTDKFYGGNGNDNVYVGLGASTLSGGTGFDIASFLNLVSPSAIGVQVDMTAGTYSSSAIAGLSGVISSFEYIFGTRFNDTISGGASNEYLSGENGDDSLAGLGGVDHLNGGDGKDIVTGGDGNDMLRGGIGNDRIGGGDGVDYVIGEGGADVLAGGPGADVFVYNAISESGITNATRDRIKDFVHLSDAVKLRDIDAKPLVDGDQAFKWLGTGAFTNAAGELRYELQGADAMVSGDVTGDGTADFQILLMGVAVLSDLDFKL
jgi:Ca2+-binding RTX toxin-like protein